MFLGELANLYRFRGLISQLTLRDMKATRKQSGLGLSWIVLQPLVQMAIFTLIFTRIVKMDTGRPASQYPIFAFTGLVSWGFLSAAVKRAAGSVIANQTLVRTTPFPKDALIHAVTLSSLVNLAANTLVLAVMMLIYRIPPAVQALWLIPIVLVVVLLAEGASLALAALNTFWRDTSHALPLVLQVWFYASPIVYPADRVPAWLMPWYRLNPMVGIVTATRNVLLDGMPPDHLAFGVAAAVSASVFLAGFAFFKRCEPLFPDLM